MKTLTLLGSAIFCLGLIGTSVFAENQQSARMINANEQIQNLDKVLAQVKRETKVPVLFPYQVPKTSDAKKYYANQDLVAVKNGYVFWINIDSTPDCNGVKYCNIGNMTARMSTSPEKFTDMKNNPITSEVPLSNGIKGYFTPGHPMGDYIPSNVQWITNGVLYSLTWSAVPKEPQEEKSMIIAMANSAIIGAGSVSSREPNKTGNPLGY